jgi:hypothetical protein
MQSVAARFDLHRDGRGRVRFEFLLLREDQSRPTDFSYAALWPRGHGHMLASGRWLQGVSALDGAIRPSGESASLQHLAMRAPRQKKGLGDAA